jgi:thiamine biosynthesis lipoprotein ApbE
VPRLFEQRLQLFVKGWAFDACRAAVTDYRREHAIVDAIEEIDGAGVFWRRN